MGKHHLRGKTEQNYSRSLLKRSELHAQRLAERRASSVGFFARKLFQDEAPVSVGSCTWALVDSSNFPAVTSSYQPEVVKLNIHGQNPATITVDADCLRPIPNTLGERGVLSECDEMANEAIKVGFGNTTVVDDHDTTSCETIDCLSLSNDEDAFSAFKLNSLCNILREKHILAPIPYRKEPLEIMGIVMGSLAALCILVYLLKDKKMRCPKVRWPQLPERATAEERDELLNPGLIVDEIDAMDLMAGKQPPLGAELAVMDLSEDEESPSFSAK